MIALIASVPICVALALTGPVLRVLGQPAEIVGLAQRFNLLRLPSVPCFLLFSAYRIYLQARGRMGPRR